MVEIGGWFIPGRLHADTTNAQGKLVELPAWAANALLVEGSSVKVNVATAPAGAAIEIDIKSSTAFAGAQTSLFATGSPDYPTIAAAKNHTAEAGSDDGTLTTTALNAHFLWLFIRQVGSTAGSEGFDLTVQLFARVYVGF